MKMYEYQIIEGNLAFGDMEEILSAQGMKGWRIIKIINNGSCVTIFMEKETKK